MANVSSTYLANLLKRTELFSDSQIETLLESPADGAESITERVLRSGFAGEDDFLQALAGILKLTYTKLASMELEQDVLEKLPTRAVFQYNVIPIGAENGALHVATNDPLNPGLADALRVAAGMRIRFVLSSSTEIARAAKKFYGVGADTVDRMIQDNRYEVGGDDVLARTDLGELDQEASIVKFVNQIIWEAIQQGATDIHFEPMEDQLRIRYRVDGVLHSAPMPPQLSRFQAAIISRIKVMANMDIAEKRLPMDGRIGMRVQSEDIDIRVSTVPTVHGESVSLRILQRKGQFIGFVELGMNDRDGDLMEKVIRRPNGIVLVTGPTGSGKSTTLYAFLHEINSIDRRILTAEEPIEYEMPGVNQVLVRPSIGLTFAKTLRHFLRQDPDIIMVGEVRDLETAEIAIQASLTGHLVFSTLHTNDASGAFTRLLDMGVEPFLAASAVEAVVAQRLVRRLCRSCKSPATTDPAFLSEIAFPVDALHTGTICDAAGCDTCRSTGFSGRGGIFEVLVVSEKIESLVINRASSTEIKQQAVSEGMKTLRDDGWIKVLKGFTTIEEVLRVTEENQ